MASAAEIMEALPSTLPEDFCEWDDDAVPAPPAGAPPAAPEPRQAVAPTPQPVAPAGSEARHARPSAPAQKVYTNHKAFLDQLLSLRPEANLPENVSTPGQAPASAQGPASARGPASAQGPASARGPASAQGHGCAIYEVLPASAGSSRARTEDGKSRPASRPAARPASRPAARVDAQAAPARLSRFHLADRVERKLVLEGHTNAKDAARKRLLIAVVACAAVVLLSLLLLFFVAARPGRSAHTAHSASARPATAVAPSQPAAAKPSPSVPSGSAPRSGR
jgi:hypothetical protein